MKLLASNLDGEPYFSNLLSKLPLKVRLVQSFPFIKVKQKKVKVALVEKSVLILLLHLQRLKCFLNVMINNKTSIIATL